MLIYSSICVGLGDGDGDGMGMGMVWVMGIVMIYDDDGVLGV